MPADVRALSEVDYALDLHLPAEELQPQVTAALKGQRAKMNLKGFRPGKVPMSVVRKMVGPQIAMEVAENAIGEAYRTAVAETEDYDVIGQPRLVELDYSGEEGAALKAEVRFSVRPEITLADLDGVPVTRIVKLFTDDDVEADLQRRLDMAAELSDAPEGAEVGATDVVTADIQPVDADGEPTGPVQHGARLVLADPNLRAELRDALVGQTAGAEVRVELPQLQGDEGVADDEDASELVDRYAVTVQGVQNRVVPELTPEFVSDETDGRTEDPAELRDEIRAELDRSWTQRAQQALEGKMAETFVRAHDFPVPATLVDATLDQMMEELRDKETKRLPEGLDVEAWRDERRPMAEDQVRWLLLKEKLIEVEDLQITEEDFEAEFAKMAGEDGDTEMIKGFFAQQPQMMDRLADQLANQRIFAALEDRFTIVEKTREDIEAEAAARKAEQPQALTVSAEDLAGAPDAAQTEDDAS